MRGGVAAVLGYLGGLIMVLGVFVGVLGASIFSLATWHGYYLLGALYQGAIDLVLALLVIIFTAYAVAHAPPDKAIGGVVVLIVAVVAYFVTTSGALIFVTLGAILGGIGGLVFLLQSAFQPRPAYAPPPS